MTSKNYEGSGSGLDLDLLIILSILIVCVSYPTRSRLVGRKEKKKSPYMHDPSTLSKYPRELCLIWLLLTNIHMYWSAMWLDVGGGGRGGYMDTY